MFYVFDICMQYNNYHMYNIYAILALINANIERADVRNKVLELL